MKSFWCHGFQEIDSLPTREPGNTDVAVTSFFPVYLQRIFTRSVSKNNSAARKILDEHSDVIFIKIDQHLEKLYKENKGFPIFWNTVYILSAAIDGVTTLWHKRIMTKPTLKNT